MIQMVPSILNVESCDATEDLKLRQSIGSDVDTDGDGFST